MRDDRSFPTHGLHSLSASVQHTPVFRVPAPLRFIIGVLNSKSLQRALYMRVCQLGVTGASARNDQEKESWWMSGVRCAMQFFVLYRRRPGADVVLGKVACQKMKAPRLPCFVLSRCFPMLGRRGVVQQGLGSSSGQGQGSSSAVRARGWGAVRAEHLLKTRSPRHSPVQGHDTVAVVSEEESKMTRRSLNNCHWSEGWEVKRILYAVCPVTGAKKAYVASI